RARSASVPNVDLLLFLASFGGHCRRHHCESVIPGRIWAQIWTTGSLMASTRRREPQIVIIPRAATLSIAEVPVM
ncbi:hypothetical protein TYRP_023667, partial [Tyrophagus putrescentiae]